MQPLPVQEQWSPAYRDDPDTNFLMNNLRHNDQIHKLCIEKLAATCRNAIADHLLCTINDRLVHIEPVMVFINHICPIIIPSSLWHIILIAMYASQATDYMG